MSRYIRIEYSADCDPHVETQYLEYSATSGDVLRALEIFRDGRVGFADSVSGRNSHDVRIPDQPIPVDALERSQEGFAASEITKAEFDKAWSEMKCE